MSKNLDAAKQYWSALFSRDPQLIADAVTHDVEWLAPPGNATAVALGVTNHMIGPEAIIRFVRDDFRRLFPYGLSVDVMSVSESENTVVFEQRQRATLANGRDFDLNYVFVFEIVDGKVHRVREYMDTQSGRQMVFGDEIPRQIF